MKKENKTWQLPAYFQKNWDMQGLPFLELAFSQGEKKLDDLVRTGESITKKAHTILGIAVTILTLSFGAQLALNLDSLSIKLFLSSTSMMTFISILLLIQVLRSYETYSIGSEPMNLIKEELVNGFDSESSIKNLYASELEDYQRRIDLNRKMNNDRIRFVDWSMYSLILSPFISGLLGYFLG